MNILRNHRRLVAAVVLSAACLVLTAPPASADPFRVELIQERVQIRISNLLAGFYGIVFDWVQTVDSWVAADGARPGDGG